MAALLRWLAGFLITPDQAYEAQLAGFDLYLSGQIRLPFYGVVHTGSILGKRFEMGRYQPRPGMGSDGGRLRFSLIVPYFRVPFSHLYTKILYPVNAFLALKGYY